MANFFDPSIPSGPEPWGIDPPPPDGEDTYGNVVSLTGKPVETKERAPAIWQSEGGWAEADIPRRPWIVPGYIMRGSVTVIAGAGSAGKSSLVKGWMVAAVFGLSFNRFRVTEPLKVLSYNTEDDLDEERRRISANVRQFDRSPAEIPPTMRIIGPNEIGTLIQRDPVSGYCIPTNAQRDIEAILDAHPPDILILDPLVELHNAEENDNTGLRAVVAYFRTLAQRYRMGVVLLHHTRKGATAPGDPDAVRGASAVVGAARVVFTVCPMSEEEAGKTGVDVRQRRLYFRLDGAKQNYAPIDGAEWFKRVPYLLDNGEEVAAAEAWIPPSPWDGVTWPVIDEIMAAIERGPSPGEFYAAAKQSKSRWAGALIMDIAARSEAQAATILKSWIDGGLLVPSTYPSPSVNHRMAACLHVDATKLSEMRREAADHG